MTRGRGDGTAAREHDDELDPLAELAEFWSIEPRLGEPTANKRRGVSLGAAFGCTSRRS